MASIWTPDALRQSIERRTNEIVEMERDYQARLKVAMELLAHEKRLLNDFQPINQLPTEVLLRIFSCYVDAVKRSAYHFIDPFCNIHLTHVCSYWKAIITDCPLLWSDVDIEWPSWRFGYMSHSKDAPLRAFFSDIWNDSLKTKEFLHSMLAQYASRIETAAFLIYASSVDRLSEMSLMRMSTLKNFQLALYDIDHNAQIRVPDLIYDLPYTLNSIRIQGSWIITNPSSLFRPNLHTLNLQCHPRSTKLTMRQCLSALAQIHSLRNLSLVNVWDEHSALDALPQVTLPHLDTLRIEGDPSVLCSVFLEHIETTSLTSIAIVGDGCQSAQDFDRLTLSLSTTVKKNPFLPSARRLSIDYSRPRSYLSISAWRLPFSSSASLEFKVTYAQRFGHDPSWNDSLLSSLDLSKLEEYLVDFVHHSSLPTFIPHIPTITALSLGCHTLDMLPLLLMPVHGLDKKISPLQSFPALQTLCFNYSRYGKTYTNDGLEEVVKNIVTAFQVRAPYNAPDAPFRIRCIKNNPYLPRLLDAVGKGVIAMYKRFMAEETRGGTPWELWFEYTVEGRPEGKKTVRCQITDFERNEWPFSEKDVQFDVMLELWVKYT